MASGFTAAAVSEGKAARQEFVGQTKSTGQFVLALAKAGSLGAFGTDFHLNASMHTEEKKIKSFLRVRK
jgi:hypothetical protein